MENLLARLDAIQEEEKSWEETFLDRFSEAHLSLSKKHEQPIPRNYTRPSSLGGCMRRIYYMRKGAPQDTVKLDKQKKNSLGVLESGTDRHERIQNVLKEMETLGMLKNIDIEEVVEAAREEGINTIFLHWNPEHTEARCKNDDLGIYFQPDGCIEFNGVKALVEIKTCSVNRMRQVKKAKYPFPEHITQATAYAAGLGLDNILYIYECRDNTERYAILVKVTDAMKEQVKTRLDDIEYHVINKIIPPREVDKCFFCEYKEACKEEVF